MKKGFKFNSKLVNRLLMVLVFILVVGIAYGTRGVVNLLGEQTNNLVNLRAKNKALLSEQSSLKVDIADVAKYGSLEQIAKSIVPQDKDQAQTVREIVDLANQNNIPLTSINFPLSSLGSLPATQAGSSPISLSQLTPVKNIGGVYTLPITVDYSPSASGIPYSQFYSFLQGLENNRRTSQVTSLTIQPVPKSNGLITFTLTINEYIKPR